MKKTSSKVEEFIRVDHAGERGAVKIYEGQLLALNTLVKNEDLKKKLDGDFQIYIPTIFLKKRNKRNKILERKINIMGDYLFCFHRNFSNQNLILDYLPYPQILSH